MAIYPVEGSLPVFFPFSKKGAAANDYAKQEIQQADRKTDQRTADPKTKETSESEKKNPFGTQQELSKEEQQKIKELQSRDREVKAHEAAHKAAGGSLTGPARFSHTTGPDGKRYATGGEVSIDTSAVPGDPQATLLKANRIRSAALAPAEPSGQDRQVATQASQMAAQARMELAKQKQGGNHENEDNLNNRPTTSNAVNLRRHALYSESGGSGNIVDEMV